ncbi:MAG: Cna B-type domain-containing protein, partial [Clostridiales bacterium]|nr:Cna B-type domain-containing protein [Clostridiales bacterium]
GEGKLTLTVSKPDDVTFNNTYTATGEYDIDTELNPNKVLTGRELADQEFTFELLRGDEIIQTAKNTADGNIPLGKLSFTQDDIGQTYNYTIREILGTEAGMAYDPMTLSFSIKVEDAREGKLNLTVTKPEDLTFNNSYTATGEYDIDTELNPNKVLTGRELADQEFTFELLRGDEIIQTAKNTADGNIPFGKLSFTQADIGETYNYTIKEIPGTEAGMAYDPMTLSFSIQVADAGQGELALTVERPENVTFNNTFTPQTMDIAIDKQWADNNNAAGQRPASIQVQLMQNGVPVGGPDTISAANGWTMTRINLPIRDANNTPYIYTVREVTVPTNYLPTYQGLMSGRLVIVNTYETPPAPPQPPIVPGPGPVVPAPEVPPAAGLASGNLGETFE